MTEARINNQVQTGSLTTVKCYIEQYESVGVGELSGTRQSGARLREKHTGRIVDLGFVTPADAEHFLAFVALAHIQSAAMSEVFSKDGERDCVIIFGEQAPPKTDEIRFVFNEHLRYLFA